ncbi:MAG: glycosyltransferase family 39 protein [Planctomycetaceae bacterium]
MKKNRSLQFILLGMILSVHSLLLINSTFVSSPNIDELAHLPAGISHWEFGRYDLYRVNPPLVRMVAALPVLLTDAVKDWSNFRNSPYSRAEFFVGKDFTKNNQFNTFRYFAIARWACIPFSLLGCFVAYCWAFELYGRTSAVVALSLYAFCPNMLAWGASITPDAAAASIALLAKWTFWEWLKSPKLSKALWAGGALGVALLCKTTAIFFFPIYSAIWIVACLRRRGKQEIKRWPIHQLGALLLTGLYLLNLGYGFEGSFTRLGDFKFVSHALSGEETPPLGANQFAGTFYGAIPVPLPSNFVRGIDLQKFDFEQGKWSYLMGEQKKGGWWYYYIVAFLVKNPLGFLVILAAAFGTAVSGKLRLRPAELFLLGPALFLFVLVSSQTGFNRYYRYILPCVPFLFIFASRVVANTGFKSRRGVFAFVATLAIVVESLSVYPHSMSFFNVAVGGPLGGPEYLLDGNIDWGQDLLELKRWYDAHPEARPFHAAYFSDWDIAPSIAEIDCQEVPKHTDLTQPPPALTPGWYAVSVNFVYGLHYFENDTPVYRYFRQMKPVDRAGYSIYIYHVMKHGQ